MRLALTVLADDGRYRADVLVSLADTATIGELAEALREALGGGQAGSGGPGGERLAVVIRHPSASAGITTTATSAQAGARLWAQGRPLDPRGAVRGTVCDGMLVALDERTGPATWLDEPRGVLELRVASGPAAGSVTRLGLGAATLGSGPGCTVVVGDPALPPLAALVVVAPDGARVTPRPGATLLLEDTPLDAEAPWPAGAALLAGDSLISLHAPEEADAFLAPAEDGGLAYNRPPRLPPARRRRRLVVPQEPKRDEGPRLQLLAALLPLLLGAVMYAVTKQALTLLFCLMSPVLLIGSWVSDSRFGRARHRTAVKEYQQARAAYEAELEQARLADQRQRREAQPDPATALLIATGPRRRLWERRADDPDMLRLRVGVTDLPAEVELVPAPGAPSGAAPPPPPPAVRSVPVSLPLASLGVVGVAGARGRSLALARWLVAQAAVLHSPRDLSLVVLAPGPDAADAWGWVRWLPHAAPRDGQDCVALVGTDPESAARRVAELVAEVERRREGRTPAAAAWLQPEPNVLVVLDGAQALRRLPGMPQVLGDGPAVGVRAVCVDRDERLLPEECSTVASWVDDAPARLRLRGDGLEALGEVLAEQVDVAWCERVARALAPVRDISREDPQAALPDSARLLELLGMPDPTTTGVLAAWERGGRTTEAPLGYCADGLFHLDLSRDGPHALVAGTTGAGKSELLQSLIASLAVGNRPEALNFVLIDYKGGSAFQDCARLPHTVGMVSDLDPHLTERALASLTAELRRREELLFQVSAANIEDYWRAKRQRPGLEPIPRLVLVIDEFASLVAELPDFVNGLVDIARRGRSLGVHLVLATQRPAGVVSADIRANTNLRIALRVTSTDESSDVIDAPDAAAISRSTPGRCYVRSGAASLVAVQAARIGGRRPRAAARARPEVTPMAWPALGRSLPRRPGHGEDERALTDLAVLVEAVQKAAAQAGADQQRSPWLPPLPATVTVAGLPPVAARDDGDVPPVPFGLLDVPAEQARAAVALDLVHGSHLLVAGAPPSGRSTALRTLAGAVAERTSPEDVHLYGVDCGANALLPLVSLPHCGAVVSRDQPERMDRLFHRLLAEVARRQQLLAALGASSLAEQRAAAPPGERLPWMVLLLDRWEGFTAAFETYDLGRLVESALRLLREGPAVGLRVVLTSDRSGLVGQVSALVDEKLVLRLADANDWAVTGVSPRDVPEGMGPGRGLRPTSAGVIEAQVALLAEDPSGPAQVAALQAIGRQAAAGHGQVPQERRPLRVDALPARATVEEASRLQPRDPSAEVTAPLWALIGVGGDELQPLGIDLGSEGPGFVVAGPPRAGRSSALVTMARSLLARGTPVVLVTPRRSPLRDLAGTEGVVALLDDGGRPELLREAVGGRERYVVVVDDAELLYDTALDAELSEVVRSGRDGGHGLVAAGTTDDLGAQYRGFLVDARRSRSGLLLAPRGAGEGDLLAVRLPRNLDAGPVGRGLLVVGGTARPVQVALS